MTTYNILANYEGSFKRNFTTNRERAFSLLKQQLPQAHFFALTMDEAGWLFLQEQPVGAVQLTDEGWTAQIRMEADIDFVMWLPDSELPLQLIVPLINKYAPAAVDIIYIKELRANCGIVRRETTPRAIAQYVGYVHARLAIQGRPPGPPPTDWT